MSDVLISAGPFTFKARFERVRAPATCAAFEAAMPFISKIIHVRWSGAAVWVPLGDLDFGVEYEDATSHPAPGEIVLYPGGISETEILLSYGPTAFASKAGQLAGNPLLTITEDLENLAELGTMTLWEGAQDIRFDKI